MPKNKIVVRIKLTTMNSMQTMQSPSKTSMKMVGLVLLSAYFLALTGYQVMLFAKDEADAPLHLVNDMVPMDIERSKIRMGIAAVAGIAGGLSLLRASKSCA